MCATEWSRAVHGVRRRLRADPDHGRLTVSPLEQMKPINIHDAKTRFSRLIARAARGEEIVIARAGHPVAKLIAYQAGRERRIAPPGSMRGKIWVADDFDAPVDELFDAVTTRDDA